MCRYVLSFIALSLASCAPPPGPDARWTADAGTMLRDVLAPHDAIVGRVIDKGIVRLLTKDHRLVSIDLRESRVRTLTLVGVDDDENLTGFGQLADGSLWTMSGWSTLVEFTRDARVVGRLALGRRDAGLHSAFGRLVYQPFDFDGGGPALVSRETPGAPATPWGTLRVRSGNDPAPLRLAQSVASCGVEVDDRVPCWLASSTDVEVIGPTGAGVTVHIAALDRWLPGDSGAFGRNPHRVIRDVWLESRDAMWILVRPSAGDVPDRRGEHGLWRVATDGRVIVRHLLPFRARIIVGADRHAMFVIAASGHVMRVEV